METEIKAIWDDLHLELEKFIRARVKDSNDVQDILQEVFIKIQLNIHKLNDSAKLTSWAYQITRNTVNDHFRKQKHTSHNNIPDLADDDADEPLYAGLSRCINQKIAQLPENYRQALLLTSLKEYSQEEAAKQLGISHTATKTHVYRAKQQLKKLLLYCRNITSDRNGKITGHNFNENS